MIRSSIKSNLNTHFLLSAGGIALSLLLSSNAVNANEPEKQAPHATHHQNTHKTAQHKSENASAHKSHNEDSHEYSHADGVHNVNSKHHDKESSDQDYSYHDGVVH